MRTFGLSIGIVALLGLAGCGGGDRDGAIAPANDEYQAVLFPSTHVLETATLQNLSREDADGTLHFNGTPAALANLKELEVIAAPVSAKTPKGMLRLVLAVESDAGGLVLRTTHAPLQLAFQKLHLKFERGVDDIASRGDFSGPLRRVQATDSKYQKKSITIQAFNGDGNDQSVDDQALFNANLGGGFSYVFGIDVDWGDVKNVPQKVYDCIKSTITGGGCSLEDLLPETTVGYSVNSSVEADLHGAGVSFLPYGADYEVGPEIPLDKIEIGFLVFFPALQVTGRVEGAASSQFEMALGASANAAAGLSYSTKSGPNEQTPTGSWHFDAPIVDATLAARSRVSVGPDLHIRLYDVAGPYAGLKAFAELQADQAKTPCYELRGGVEGHLGFDIRIELPPFDPFSLANFGPKKFVLFDELVDSGSCKPLPGGPVTGSGGKPAPAAFSNPTYTPWSKSYGGLVDTFPYGGFGAIIASTDITPTIDGRFVVAGSGNKALTKIDRDGDLVWAKSYLRAERLWDTQGFELLPTATVSTSDAAMFAIAHPYSLLKLEANGDLIWAKELGGAYNDAMIRLTALETDGAGALFVGGTYGEDQLDKRAVDAWVMRYDEHGTLGWSKRIGSATDSEMVRTLVPYQGGVVAAGSTFDAVESNFRAWVARFDAAGALVWARRYDTRDCGSAYLSNAHVTTGLATRDGDLVFGGVIDIGNTFIFKLKPDGSLAWSASETDLLTVDLGWEVTSLIELPTSGYLAAGYWSEHNQGNNHNDLWLAALDGVGRIQWLRRYGAGRTEGTLIYEDDVYPTLQLTDDGGALIAALSVPLASDEKGLWVMKPFAKDGQIAFSAASAIRNDAPGYQAANVCVLSETWNPTIVDQPALPKPLALTVQNVTATTQTQAP